MDLHHCQFDNVCCSTLQRCVYRRSFTELSHCRIRITDFRYNPGSAEQRFHKSPLPRKFQRGIDIRLNAFVTLKITVDVDLGFPGRNAKFLGKAKTTYPVNNAEVYYFCGSPHLRCNPGGPDAEDFLGDPGMDVFVLRKSLQQQLISRHVGEHSQLNLRVIGRQQNEAILSNECLAYLPSFISPYRDILQVRVRTAQPSCCNDHLVE